MRLKVSVRIRTLGSATRCPRASSVRTRLYHDVIGAIVAPLVGIGGCGGSAPESPPPIVEGCDAPAVDAWAALYHVQLAFEPCGANKFQDASFSPDGTRLYFR